MVDFSLYKATMVLFERLSLNFHFKAHLRDKISVVVHVGPQTMVVFSANWTGLNLDRFQSAIMVALGPFKASEPV